MPSRVEVMTASNCRIEQECVKVAPQSAGTMQGSSWRDGREGRGDLRVALGSLNQLLIEFSIASLLLPYAIDIGVSTGPLRIRELFAYF